MPSRVDQGSLLSGTLLWNSGRTDWPEVGSQLNHAACVSLSIFSSPACVGETERALDLPSADHKPPGLSVQVALWPLLFLCQGHLRSVLPGPRLLAQSWRLEVACGEPRGQPQG